MQQLELITISRTKSVQIGVFLRGYSGNLDIQERVNQVVGIEYEGCCWRAAMIHAYERDKVTETNGGHSMKLQVELKGPAGVLGRGTCLF